VEAPFESLHAEPNSIGSLPARRDGWISHGSSNKRVKNLKDYLRAALTSLPLDDLPHPFSGQMEAPGGRRHRAARTVCAHDPISVDHRNYQYN
jgi:hypothetical protein